MVQAGRPALCASSETAGHEAHHSKDEFSLCVFLKNVWLFVSDFPNYCFTVEDLF